jgi:hypothetical protein
MATRRAAVMSLLDVKVREDHPRIHAFVMGIGRHMAVDGTHKAHVSCRLVVGEGEDEEGPFLLTLSMDIPVDGVASPNFLYEDGLINKVSADRLLAWQGSDFNYRYEVPR